LQQLAKKASEKKNKHASFLAVGDNPTKTFKESGDQQKQVILVLTPQLLTTFRCHGSTLNHAYSEILSSMSNSAQDHIDLAEALTTQVTEPLKAIERRNGEYKKKVPLVRKIIFIVN